jgi:hypothetical protein
MFSLHMECMEGGFFKKKPLGCTVSVNSRIEIAVVRPPSCAPEGLHAQDGAGAVFALNVALHAAIGVSPAYAPNLFFRLDQLPKTSADFSLDNSVSTVLQCFCCKSQR